MCCLLRKRKAGRDKMGTLYFSKLLKISVSLLPDHHSSNQACLASCCYGISRWSRNRVRDPGRSYSARIGIGIGIRIGMLLCRPMLPAVGLGLCGLCCCARCGCGGGGTQFSAESGYCRPEETRVSGRIRWTRLR
jgi:hypothetical protein